MMKGGCIGVICRKFFVVEFVLVVGIEQVQEGIGEFVGQWLGIQVVVGDGVVGGVMQFGVEQQGVQLWVVQWLGVGCCVVFQQFC